MSFYDLSKDERIQLVVQISDEIQNDLINKQSENIILYFSDEDTYIRKSAYLCVGKIYMLNKPLQKIVISTLNKLFLRENSHIRQTVINAAGEIGKTNFDVVKHFFDNGLSDSHHSVRNAVIGSVKKMGERNPEPILIWSKKYLHHIDSEIRREICHGLELYGRTHPEAVLPLLKELQNEKVKRVRNMLIHVIGQISYKKGCLEKVMGHLNTWENKELVKEFILEILNVHESYKNFAALTVNEAAEYILNLATQIENSCEYDS